MKRKLSKNNKSGYRNVFYHKGNDVWCVRLTKNLVRYHGGYYVTLEEAVAARDRQRAALKLEPA